MEVVESFTTSCYDNSEVLRRANVLVVRPVTPDMSQAVDTPCCIEGKGIAECITNYKCIQVAFIPEVPWNSSWNYRIENGAQKLVIPGNYKIKMYF